MANKELGQVTYVSQVVLNKQEILRRIQDVLFTNLQPVGPPNPPTIRCADRTDTSIKIGITDLSTNENGFYLTFLEGDHWQTRLVVVYAGSPDQVEQMGRSTGYETFFNHDGLRPGTDYTYRATAFNKNGERYSELATGTTGSRHFSLQLTAKVPKQGVESWHGRFPLIGSAAPGSYLTGVAVPNLTSLGGQAALDLWCPARQKWDVRVPQETSLTAQQMKDVFGSEQPALPVEMWTLVEMLPTPSAVPTVVLNLSFRERA